MWYLQIPLVVAKSRDCVVRSKRDPVCERWSDTGRKAMGQELDICWLKEGVK